MKPAQHRHESRITHAIIHFSSALSVTFEIKTCSQGLCKRSELPIHVPVRNKHNSTENQIKYTFRTSSPKTRSKTRPSYEEPTSHIRSVPATLFCQDYFTRQDHTEHLQSVKLPSCRRKQQYFTRPIVHTVRNIINLINGFCIIQIVARKRGNGDKQGEI